MRILSEIAFDQRVNICFPYARLLVENNIGHAIKDQRVIV